MDGGQERVEMVPGTKNTGMKENRILDILDAVFVVECAKGSWNLTPGMTSLGAPSTHCQILHMIGFL